jgi:uncharacterized protein
MPTLKIKDSSLGKINCIFLAQTSQKGIGVFTNKKIKAGTLIEIAPVIVMDITHKKHLLKTTLKEYIFMWGKTEDKVAMALGWVPLYNHSFANNCRYQMNFKTNEIMVLANTDILPHQELCINYNGNSKQQVKFWF